jgi:UDP-N-acetylglucosamine 2-epimerase (non-hydrolysing)
MKIAPIIRAIEAARAKGLPLSYRLVHTGQHYDPRLSADFFAQLAIPEPHVNLEVGSGSQAAQAAAIMVGYERELMAHRADLCIVVGDVTSTMACAIVAQKLGVPVAHVEGGLRSGDWRMPEEINRLVTDAISNLFLTTSDAANDHLRRSGVTEERIAFVGNTMIDTLLANMARLQPPAFWDSMRLEPRGYFVMTLHRPSNVDNAATAAALLGAVGAAARELPVIFPVHPRTRQTLDSIAGVPPNIVAVDAQPYLEFNYLVRHAKAVITDSGGVTEEATVMGVPCLTMRDTTERPETVTVGTNELIGTEPAGVRPALDRVFEGKWKKGGIPEKWDGRAAERIVDAVVQFLGISVS